jgi:hypothetical protein
MLPLDPDVPLSAEEILTEPLEVAELDPLDNARAPPCDAPAVSPATIDTMAPVPLVLFPALKMISPPAPPLEEPLTIRTSPDAPSFVSPDCTVTPPLMPLSPLSAVIIMADPVAIDEAPVESRTDLPFTFNEPADEISLEPTWIAMPPDTSTASPLWTTTVPDKEAAPDSSSTSPLAPP